MDTPTTIEAKLQRLAELKAKELELAPIKQEIEQLRYDLQLTMQKNASKRTEPFAGLFAVREERKSLQVTDEEQVAAWLYENVMDIMQYYKLDPAALKVLASETLNDTGELIPGTETVVTETISIRAAK